VVSSILVIGADDHGNPNN